MNNKMLHKICLVFQYSLSYLWVIFLFSIPLIAFEPQPVTPFPVLGYREIPFYDDFHKIQRQLLVWYPVEPVTMGVPSKNAWVDFQVALNPPPAQTKVKRPLIAISHGFTGNPYQLSWLIRGLVHQGFIVIGIQHLDFVNGKINANFWQRALDIQTILDRFLSNPMAEFANPNQIGIAGYSVGGTTALVLGGGRLTKLDLLDSDLENSSFVEIMLAKELLPTLNKEMMSKDWRDSRVKAAFMVAPAWAWLFDEASLAKISIPTYLIAAAEDRIVSTQKNAAILAHRIPSAIYQVIPGKANHFIFMSALNTAKRLEANPYRQLDVLFEDDVSVNRSWIQLQVVDEAVRFFKSFL